MWLILSPLLRAAIPYVIIALGVGGGFLYVKTHYYNQGWTAAINAIAAKDKEATDAAEKARNRHRECVDSGGVWDVTTGKCGR